MCCISRERTCQIDAPLGARFMHCNGLHSLLCIGLRLFDFMAKCTLLKHIPSKIAQVWVIFRIDHENLPPLNGAKVHADQHAPVKGLWYCKIDAANSGLIAIEDDLV